MYATPVYPYNQNSVWNRNAAGLGDLTSSPIMLLGLAAVAYWLAKKYHFV